MRALGVENRLNKAELDARSVRSRAGSLAFGPSRDPKRLLEASTVWSLGTDKTGFEHLIDRERVIVEQSTVPSRLVKFSIRFGSQSLVDPRGRQ